MTAEEEIKRVVPVIRDLARHGVTISIDSRHAATIEAALDAGAHIVNDISGLTHDPASFPLLQARPVPVILMHMQGTPLDMQHDPHYEHAALTIADVLTCYAQKLHDSHDPSMIALESWDRFWQDAST